MNLEVDDGIFWGKGCLEERLDVSVFKANGYPGVACAKSFFLKSVQCSALAGVAQWIELRPADSKVAGSIPG